MRLNMAVASLAAGAAILTCPGVALASTATPAVRVVSERAEPVLAPGSSGSTVRKLQRRLNALHYYTGESGGSFGSGTEEAVWAFQEVQGIPATGVVASATWRALAHPKSPGVLVRHGGKERVEVNLGRHYLVVYQHNHVVLISHISAGGGYYFCSEGSCSYAVTPTGNYQTLGYLSGWVQVPLGEMYNPVFFIGRAFAIHGESYVPLGPVSHGCVRIPMDVAQIFHKLVRTHGTPVYIRW
jgi:Putative peptidoglycan binding domain/L,D-transpeptidase catalytic domain